MIAKYIAQFNIGTRIGAGFACILVLLVAAGATGTAGFRDAKSNAVEFGRIAHNYERLMTIDTSFAQLRLHTAIVSGTGSAEAEKAARNLMGIISENARQAKGDIKSTIRKEMFARMMSTMGLYSSGFDAIAKKKAEEKALVEDRMRSLGSRLQQGLSEFMHSGAAGGNESDSVAHAGLAQELLLTSRLNLNIFAATPDPKFSKASEEAIMKLPTALDDMSKAAIKPEQKTRVEDLQNVASQYARGLRAAIAVITEKDRLDKDMSDKLGAEMREQINALSKSQLTALDDIRDATISDLDWEMKQGFVLAAGGLVIGIMLALLISRGIARPIQGMTETMSALAAGDLKVVVPAQENRDEIGDMAKAVMVFRDAAVEKLRLEAEAEAERLRSEEARRQAEEEAIRRERDIVSASIGAGMAKLAAKDLTFRLTDELPHAYRKLQSDFNSALSEIETALRGVHNSTSNITSGSQEISSASDDLSRRTEQNAASLEETAAALEQITTTLSKTAEGAKQARAVVSTAKVDAERGGGVVRQAVDAMGKIEKSSQQIGQIIGVIDEIAFQTNLLALNAGVEAARAGDAGRGFAVVASEVRALAQRSAEAAKEIKGLISASVVEVVAGVKLVAETGAALEQIVLKVTEIDTVVNDIAASAHEQATGLQQVNVAVGEMDQVTQQNAAMAEEATAASRSLAEESAQLANLVGQFHVNDIATDGIRTELRKVAPHAFRKSESRKAGHGSALAIRDNKASSRRAGHAVATEPMLKRTSKVAAGGNDGWDEF